MKNLLLLLLVLFTSCVKENATDEQIIEKRKLELNEQIEHLIVVGFEYDEDSGIMQYRLRKFTMYGATSSTNYYLKKPKGFFKIGDTLQ